MRKILTVLGARPQFIKAAVLSRLIEQEAGLEEVIVHTGQHFDDNMSEIFFRELGIPAAAYNLGVNKMGHGAMTGRMMELLEPVVEKESPDLVLVYGDTNSTLAGALVASKNGLPVAHVEAGLRSGNMEMPEEINRILTDRISNLLFCPTKQAVRNLDNEGFSGFGSKVVLTGDIMKDSVTFFQNEERSVEQMPEIASIPRTGFALATIHRQENTGDRETLLSIFKGLESVSNEIPVVMPLHPRTKAALSEFGIESRIHLIDPVGYAAMQKLLDSCELVITDSGGLQKEAYFHKKPSLIVRPQTEWVELIDLGLAQLVKAEASEIKSGFDHMRNSNMNFNQDLYGTDPGRTILNEIKGFLGVS